MRFAGRAVLVLVGAGFAAGGCGRIDFDPVGAGARCVPLWTTGAIDARVTRLANVNSSSYDADPFVTRDGRWLYFASGRGASGDVYRAAWSGSAFDQVVPVADLNTPSSETRVSLTADGLTAFVASSRPGAGFAGSNVWLATRADVSEPFADFSAASLASANSDDNDYDPYVSADGLRLYFAPGRAAPQNQEIVVASRAVVDADFGAPVPLGELNSTGDDSDPAPSADERVIVFSTTRAGPNELWYATRPARDVPFSAPQPVPGVNDPVAYQGDPFLAADGCTLYFSSDRTGGVGSSDLWMATFGP